MPKDREYGGTEMGLLIVRKLHDKAEKIMIKITVDKKIKYEVGAGAKTEIDLSDGQHTIEFALNFAKKSVIVNYPNDNYLEISFEATGLTVNNPNDVKEMVSEARQEKQAENVKVTEIVKEQKQEIKGMEQDGMVYCQNCGAQIAVASAFCSRCGIRVSDKTDSSKSKEPTDSIITQQKSEKFNITKFVLYIVLGIILMFMELLIGGEGLMELLACVGVGIFIGFLARHIVGANIRGITGIIAGVLAWFLYGYVTEPILVKDSLFWIAIFLFLPVVVLNVFIECIVALVATRAKGNKENATAQEEKRKLTAMEIADIVMGIGVLLWIIGKLFHI